jgi:hypothetical protein
MSETSPVPWLNPAGGLRYHLRGFRYARRLWSPFRFALAEWLYGWQPPEKRLVLVGPSAGYCLEPFTLERFDEIICLEPDPIARFLFERRLRRAPLEHRPRLRFETRDLILGDAARFGEFLAAQGSSAVLFSNFLGQLRVLLGLAGPDPRLETVKGAIVTALDGHSWASFHDRLSGALIPALEEPFDAPRRLRNEELADTFYGGHEAGSGLIGATGEQPLLDHLTEGLFPPERPHRYFTWELEPGHFHLIEATRLALTAD